MTDGNGFFQVHTALLKPALSVVLAGGKLTSGAWQQIVFIDFDNPGRDRNISIQILGG